MTKSWMLLSFICVHPCPSVVCIELLPLRDHFICLRPGSAARVGSGHHENNRCHSIRLFRCRHDYERQRRRETPARGQLQVQEPPPTAEDIKKVEEAFQALKGKIPQIVALEWGTNVSKEKLDKGFTHCFLLTFKNEQDRDAYIVHPDHKAFGKIVGPVLDDVFVIDFVAKD